LALVFLVLGVFAGVASASDAANPSGDSEETEINLVELSDEELEAICTSRGFELVREIDDTSGEPISYTHDDYVDAAKECLELEEEMESFFQENPDLLGDLQTETEAMMEEKEALEKRLAEAQDRLVKEKSKHAEKIKREALVSPADKSDKSGGNEYLNSLPDGNETRDEKAPHLHATQSAETDTRKEKKESDTSGDERTTGENEKQAESGSGSNSDGKLENETTESEPKRGDSDEVDAAEVSSSSEDGGPLAFSRLTKETLLEFRDKVQKDLTRIGEIIVPEPLRDPLKEMMGVAYRVAKSAGISTASMMKRYFHALLDSVKEVRAAEAENEGDDGVLKKYLSAILKAVKKARADKSNDESKQEHAPVEEL